MLNELPVKIEDSQKAIVTAYAQDYLDRNQGPDTDPQEIAKSIQKCYEESYGQTPMTSERLINVFDTIQPVAEQ